MVSVVNVSFYYHQDLDYFQQVLFLLMEYQTYRNLKAHQLNINFL